MKDANYRILISEETLIKIRKYKDDHGRVPCGQYLHDKLADKDLHKMTTDEFLELLIQTKKTLIFAESAIQGPREAEKGVDANDWNARELDILGDLNFSLPDVEIYDNGVWSGDKIEVHHPPLQGGLIYVPGALLKGRGSVSDMAEVAPDGKLDEEAFIKLYIRRLLPALIEANRTAGPNGAVLTIPGMGCGAFAGAFEGQLESPLKHAIARVLEENKGALSNVKLVVFDTNTKRDLVESQQFGGIEFRTIAGDFGKSASQLQSPSSHGEEYKNCKLISVVAWDHVSWPGNDYYGGSRSTDDGVKAAATNTCALMTGIEGEYHPDSKKFKPTETPKKTWDRVIRDEKLQLKSQGKVEVVGAKGEVKTLAAAEESLNLGPNNNDAKPKPHQPEPQQRDQSRKPKESQDNKSWNFNRMMGHISSKMPSNKFMVGCAAIMAAVALTCIALREGVVKVVTSIAKGLGISR